MNAQFTVLGRPVPKHRPRVNRNGTVYTPQKCRVYEESVGWAAKQVFRNPYDGPIELQIRIFIASKGGKIGDLDNYIKSISDGLNHIAYRDDSQVTKIIADLVSMNARRSEQRCW